MLAAGDAAVGLPVLRELYSNAGPRPLSLDLPALWRRLGVRADGTLDATASDAALARALVAPVPGAAETGATIDGRP